MTAFSIASIAGLPAGIMLGNRFGIRTPFGILGLFGLATWVVAFKILPPMRGHLSHECGEEDWVAHPERSEGRGKAPTLSTPIEDSGRATHERPATQEHRMPGISETWSMLRQPAHLRAYAFMIMLVIGSFTIAPHFSDFLVHNVGREKDDLAYVYLCGGLLTFVTLPLVGRCADRFGKRRVFRLRSRAAPCRAIAAAS
jgi:predicted MFS family arabinose efflux permease